MASRKPKGSNGKPLPAVDSKPPVKKSSDWIAKAEAPHARTERPSVVPGNVTRTRSARLRLVHVDPWSVMRTTFLLSLVFGITLVVAVFMLWLILSGMGVWSSINSSVRTTVGNTTTVPFDITNYIGLGRVVGFSMLAAVIDTVLFTALATLGAFLYNLSANLIGGVEATYAEER